MTFTTGSISSGTLRPQDLAPAFLSLLEDVDPTIVGTEDHDNWRRSVAMIVATDGEWEQTGDVLADLDDAINAALPKGLYFGTIEGDGAEFGVWETDDEGAEFQADLEDHIMLAEQEGKISPELRDALLAAVADVIETA